MKKKINLLVLFLVCLVISVKAQQRVGIGTNTPLRTLELYGSAAQYARMHSNTSNGSTAGLELVRGDDDSNARDWKIENKSSALSLMTGTDNFTTAGTEFLRLTDNGCLGIGTQNPITRLHVDGGEAASNTLDGHLLIGTKTGANLVMDGSKILARNNGAPAALYMQAAGGNTWFGSGNVFFGVNGINTGKVNVGATSLNGKLNLEDGAMQLYLKNTEGNNDWYIGASNSTWQTGDDFLIFSPTSSHLNARLLLNDFPDNDGFEAPVMIMAPSSNKLLFDGNEIDAVDDPLYFNSNSDENIYINPSGGKVGIGTSSPTGRLTIKTEDTGLGLQRGTDTWWISPVQNGDIQFWRNNNFLAYVSWANGGEWIALSDRNFKENIIPMESMLGKIRLLRPSSYTMIHDETHRPDIGFIAQEVNEVLPEVVSFADDQYGINYDQLTVVAIKGIQEQSTKLAELMAKADAMLEGK